MVKTREKKVVHTGLIAADMEAAFSEFAIADAKLQKINATMDVEFTRIRDKWADEITKLTDQKEKAFDILQAYALENKSEIFSKKRSMETAHGSFGFRLGTPKLKLLKGFTWSSVTNMLKEFLPDYVRVSEEAAKDKLLADRDSEFVVPLLPRVGVTVVQEESFFVEPKKEGE